MTFFHTARKIISFVWERIMRMFRERKEPSLGPPTRPPSFNGFIAYLYARPPHMSFSAFDPYEDAYAEYCRTLRTRSPYSLRGIAEQLDVPVEVIGKIITAPNYGEAAERARNYRVEIERRWRGE